MTLIQVALVLIPAVFFSLQGTVLASPPGLIKWETFASPSGCGGQDLFSIGFGGDSSCVSLADDAPTDYYLLYVLNNCTISLFSEAGCADDTLVYSIYGPPSDDDESCVEPGVGFRALSVSC